MSTSQNGCGCYWQSQPFFIKSGVIDVIKSEKAKMLAGELFNVYDPELVSERAAARQQVEAFNQLGETDPQQSRTIIKQLFGATGEKVEVHATFRCD